MEKKEHFYFKIYIRNNVELFRLTFGNGAVSADKDRIEIKPYAPTFAETKEKCKIVNRKSKYLIKYFLDWDLT